MLVRKRWRVDYYYTGEFVLDETEAVNISAVKPKEMYYYF